MTWAFETAVRTIWQEARGGHPIEIQAVAHVLVNRLRCGRWGGNFAHVCLAPEQFSGWNTHDINRVKSTEPPDDDPVIVGMRAVLEKAMAEPDPTGGATHYYAESMTEPPYWAKHSTSCGKFGRQFFFKHVP